MRKVPNAVVKPQAYKPRQRAAVALCVKESTDTDWMVLNSILVPNGASPSLKQDYATQLFVLRDRWRYSNHFSGDAKFSVRNVKVWA